MKKEKYQWLYMLASSMIIIGALPLFGANEWLKFVYALGVAGYMLYYLIFNTGAEPSILERRIIHLNRYASLLLLASAVARFGILDRFGQNLWILFLGLALFFILYANILLLKKKN